LQQQNHAVTLSLLPPTHWDGEENRREKGKKPVGWGKNSLTEWQREKKIINNTDNKHTKHAAFSPPDTQLAPE